MKSALTAGVYDAAFDQPFRPYLAEVLAAKQRSNPRFSLRAFAQQLELEHATLSQLLRGKRPFTAAQIHRIGLRLGLDEAALAPFLPLPRPVPAHLAARPADAEARSGAQDWLGGAILELTRLACFRADTRWLAATLGTGPDAINVALQQLLRSGQLVMRAADRWEDASEAGTVALDPPAEARVAAHEAACRAIARTPVARQRHAQAVLALGPEQLPAVTELIGRFQRELAALAAGVAAPDAVYQVIVSFVPLTDPGAP